MFAYIPVRLCICCYRVVVVAAAAVPLKNIPRHVFRRNRSEMKVIEILIFLPTYLLADL